MNKKIYFFILISIYALIIILIRYPRDIIEITGQEPESNSSMKLKIIHRNNILECGTAVESSNENDFEEIFEYLKTFTFTRASENYSKFDEL